MALTQTFRGTNVLPGFRVTMGFTLVYLTALVLIPLSGLFIEASALSWTEVWKIISSPRVRSAFQVSFGMAFVAALINAFFGMIIAWVLVRYPFPGKRWVDAIIDLPFALPTAVAGIALSALYAPNGWIGRLLEPLGIHVAFTPLGIAVALIFVGLPFVVRTIEPVLQEVDRDMEEAAASLGASRTQTFIRVIFPTIYPALLTGFAMAFARGLGEYGSVIFIAGNVPLVSEIVPLVIIIELEEYNIPAATAIAGVMLVASFALLLLINVLQKWSASRLVR